MLQFHFNRITGTDVSFTEFDVSSEWKIIILAEEPAVEIRRNDASEEIHISGTLTLHNLKSCHVTFGTQNSSKQEFSRFLKAGSTSEKFYFDNLSPSGVRLKYRLQGHINIFNVNPKCDGECKKCIHVKSLVELSNDLERMLDPQTCCFTDVQLKCCSESIPAHKSILSTRSSVFAAMFKNSMKESHKNEVDINDMDLSVLRIMLTYIYTGKTPDLTVSLAADLLFASDKYQLQDLKRVICDFLKDNLSLQNVLRVIVLGDLHSENELKYSAINYICGKCKKFSDLEKTEEWKTLLKERSALAMEILTTVVKSKDEK